MQRFPTGQEQQGSTPITRKVLAAWIWRSLCITTVVGYHHILLQSGGAMGHATPASRLVTSWKQFQDSEFSHDLKWEVMVEGEVKEIVAAIKDGTALAVSNGLYKEGRGVAAWTIELSLAKDK